MEYEYVRISENSFGSLRRLHVSYKDEIGESLPGEEELDRLRQAMEEEQILFYGCMADGELAACCSVTPTFSSFDYRRGGILEDFYIMPEHRYRGIARALIRFAYRESGVSTLTVGCADCDMEMYRAIGFGIHLGNMLAYQG
ncbi:MAG: GNAT family N-acetyltransferase [Clostridia bacterium]|nr:GNAT family N-acetyltransferase [Clostridia bacterium]